MVRATPCTLKLASERLATDAGVEEIAAKAALQNLLAVASKPERDRRGEGSVRPFFAFKLHQFLSGAGRAFATLEAPGQRLVTLDSQQFAPGRPDGVRLYASISAALADKSTIPSGWLTTRGGVTSWRGTSMRWPMKMTPNLMRKRLPSVRDF